MNSIDPRLRLLQEQSLKKQDWLKVHELTGSNSFAADESCSSSPTLVAAPVTIWPRA